MKTHPYPLKKIGLIGGGQLARMMIYRAKKLGFHFTVLDADPAAGAVALADRHIAGGLYDPVKLRELVESCEVTTYDIEHTDTAALKVLESEGNMILPSPRLLEIVQNKRLQKELYLKKGLPVASYVHKTLDQLEAGDFPVVQKTVTGGYDGKGVQVLRSAADLPKVLGGETFLEAWIPFDRELGVMVARGTDHSVQVYPVTHMVFDPELNICTEIHAPAELDAGVEKRARDLAVAAVEALDGAGVFGVELFLCTDGSLLLNEVAPRPHNSGHYTMEACGVCQFENHLRAVSGLPLGEPAFLQNAVMVNLLGRGKGRTVLEGLDQALAVPGFSLHLYGKEECRPGRKMGHFTVTAPTLETALERAHKVNNDLKITGAESV